MRLLGPNQVSKALRARIDALPRRMRTGQHGGHPAEYPLLWVVLTNGWLPDQTYGEVIAAYATAYETEAGILSLRGCQVARKYRGRGLQRRLLRARLRWARRHGMRTVRTYVAVDNAPSLVNVLRAGFAPFRVTDGFLEMERRV